MSPIAIVDTLPRYISPDEHKTMIASTPASFSDIPPVLRHQEDNVSITLEPPVEGFTTEECAKGTLYIIERYALKYGSCFSRCTTELRIYSVLIYMAASGRGIQVEYPSITLHAISRAESGPSIYCQLDESAPSPENSGDDVDTEMRELTIVPQAPTARTLDVSIQLDSHMLTRKTVEPIFEALSICAALHPDPADELDDDDDAFIDVDGDSPFETFTGADGEELSEVGRVRSNFINDNRFAPY